MCIRDSIRFVQADALDPAFAQKAGGPFDLVISNPPYIPESEWATLQKEVKGYEPRLALVSPTGFEFYRSIAAAAPELLNKGGVLCFELHADGAEGVKKLLGHEFRDVQVMQDYSRLDRALSCIVG